MALFVFESLGFEAEARAICVTMALIFGEGDRSREALNGESGAGTSSGECIWLKGWLGMGTSLVRGSCASGPQMVVSLEFGPCKGDNGMLSFGRVPGKLENLGG